LDRATEGGHKEEQSGENIGVRRASGKITATYCPGHHGLQSVPLLLALSFLFLSFSIIIDTISLIGV
jgi:hypothetical protein